MKETVEILSYLSKGCIWLRVFATLTIVCATNLQVHARETYIQFATRLLEQPPNGTAVDPNIEELIRHATNSYRATLKLPLLKPGNTVLTFGARAHAMDLFAQRSMGHVSSTGQDFESRVRALNKGQMFLAAMAENAARLRNSNLGAAQKANALVQQWIKSPGHRKNLANRSYVSVAIGVVTYENQIYAVQIFSGPEVKTNLSGGLQ
jgi:uncharacterized protein YkwD